MNIQATALESYDPHGWMPAWQFPEGDLRIIEETPHPCRQAAVIRAQQILEAGFAQNRAEEDSANLLRDSFQPKEETSLMAQRDCLTDDIHTELAEVDYSAIEARVLAQNPDAYSEFVAYCQADTDAAKAMAAAYGIERDLDVLAADIHTQNLAAGWWDGWADKMDRHQTAMMLVISEMAEAMEGVRKDLMDDHLPHHKMFDVELADAAIRLLDLAGAYETDLSKTGNNAASCLPDLKGLKPPEQLFFVIQTSLVFFTEEVQVEAMLAGVFAIALCHEIDLFPIIAEKRAYNARRADHKRENRAAPGGKAF